MMLSATTLQGVEVLEDMRGEVERIRELFAPLKIPVTYTSRQQVEDSKTVSKEYEWGPSHLLDTSTIEIPKESSDIIDETQELMCLKLQKEIEEIRLKRQED